MRLSILLYVLLSAVIFSLFDPSTIAAAIDLSMEGGAASARGTDHPAELFAGDGSIFRTITNMLLFLIGAIAVIMLVIGGLRYVISGGDQAAVTAAKNTILYAIVGIIVAFLAYAAVDFVIAGLSGGISSGGGSSGGGINAE